MLDSLCVGAPPMTVGCRRLFEYAMLSVTAADVAAFAPSDPGYPDYVRAFTTILATRELPSRANFDITETIGLTRWDKAEKQAEPNRFRRFRTFINVVGLSLSVDGKANDEVL